MLHHYLQRALNDIQHLTQITLQDIADIKEAKHENLFGRVKVKEELIVAFESNKAVIDHTILKLSKEAPEGRFEELLDDEVRSLLAQMRESLAELKRVNKNYARMVLAVSEFYNTLLERLLPSDSKTYSKQGRRASSFLQVKA